MKTIVLTQGNLPLISATLHGPTCAIVDLTGCTVQFVFEQKLGPIIPGGTGNNSPFTFTANATVVGSPANGQVSYQFVSGQTNLPGEFEAQWLVTNTATSAVTVYPVSNAFSRSTVIHFEIKAPLPVASPQTIVQIQQLRVPVRVTLGDFDKSFPNYSDEAIDDVVRTKLMCGEVPGQKLGMDRKSILPGITQPCDLARLMYKAALTFKAPETAQYSYRTRAIEEKFGREDFFIRELQNAIYELDNGRMFDSFQSFYGWVNALRGLDIWGLMTDMNVNAPVMAVSIGPAGITVQTR
ncbi:MAG TPA: hypothetical protein VH413_16240 [Verrucomicrobiae bacterium]|nr:hypothetical protein [Verrucomicrobiae bacterium]